MTITVQSNEAPAPIVEAPKDAPTEAKAETQPEVEAKLDGETSTEQEAQAEVEPEIEAETEVEAKANDDDEAEDIDGKEDDSNNTDKPKRQGGYKKRIDKLRNQRMEAEQKAEYWRQEALRAQADKAQAKPEAPKNIPQPLDKPKAENFETHESYIEALTDWKLEQKFKSQEIEKRNEQVKKEVQTKSTLYAQSEAEAKTLHKDFVDVIEDTDELLKSKGTTLSLALQEAILDSDLKAELTYQLAKHPEELLRINSLTPIAAARELGKFEARFSKPTQSSEKKTTKAPAPITPVRARGEANPKSIFDPTLSFKEFARLRNEQERSRSRG